MSIKTYDELIKLPTYLERFQYLQLHGRVGRATFADERFLNQVLYNSHEWKHEFRPKIIIRDNGCDLGVEGYELDKGIIVHHIEPLTIDDVLERRPCVFDPNNVICCSLNTHNAIHYGDESLLILDPVIRTQNDTIPWR